MKVIGQKEIRIDSTLAEEVARRSGENVFLCYQCRKCASGCPSRTFMDSTPTELMRYVQLGMADEAMKGNTAWFCVSCQTCSAREVPTGYRHRSRYRHAEDNRPGKEDQGRDQQHQAVQPNLDDSYEVHRSDVRSGSGWISEFSHRQAL